MKFIKRNWYVIVACLFCTGLANIALSQTALDYRNTTPKNQFPNFTASIDSVVYNNKTIAGKIVFINFWKSTCSPCIAEIDALNNMYMKLKDRQDFVFLSFTPDDPEIIDMLIDKYRIKFPVLSLSAKYIHTIKFAKGYPTALILDENGEVIYSRFGGSSYEKEARRIVRDEIFLQLKLVLDHKPLKPSY